MHQDQDTGTDPLSGVHRAYLRDHAVSDEVISAAGIYTSQDLIVFPWRDGDLETYQTRPWPGAPGDYRWQAKPLHFGAWRPISDDGGPVIIAEGTKQSLAVASWAPPGYAVYGMQGCDGWRNLELTRLARFEGRDVFVMLDADAGAKLRVYEAGEKLAELLGLEGARPRFIPSPAWGKGGIDDYLATVDPERREQQITRLTERAQPKPASRRPKNGQKVAEVAEGATGTPSPNWAVAEVAEVALPPGYGAALLDETIGAITRFVVFSDPHHAVAATLYAAVTHAVRELEVAPRLRIKSPVKQCGKTRLLDVLGCLAHKPQATASISAAALVRSIGGDPATLIMDEMDAVFSGKAAGDEMAEMLRGILNAGFGRGKFYDRYNANTGEVEHWPTFALAILAGIGDLPDTIEDRAVVIPMTRKDPAATVARFRLRRDPLWLRDLGARLAAWAGPLAAQIGAAEPPMPPGLSDRAEDVWEPLIAVADAAGGHWPGLARETARLMASAAATADADRDHKARLLADLRTVFGAAPALHTSTILATLNGMRESPWPDWYGRGLNERQLADMLRPFGVRSKDVKIGGVNLKGYRSEDLHGPWSRYLSPPGGGATSATSATAQLNGHGPVAPSATSATSPLPDAPPTPYAPYVGPVPPPVAVPVPTAGSIPPAPSGLSADRVADLAALLRDIGHA